MEAPPETADSFLGIIGRDALRVTLKEVMTYHHTLCEGLRIIVLLPVTERMLYLCNRLGKNLESLHRFHRST